MKRRTLVHTLAGSLTVAVAGCTSASDNGADTDGADDEPETDGADDEPETDGADDEPEADAESDPSDEDSTDESEPELTTLESITAVEDRYDDGSQAFSGSGSEKTDEFDLRDAITVFIAEHDGDDRFEPEMATEDRLRRFLPLREVGPYEGTGGAGVPADTYHLDVIASGDWSVEIAQPESPEEAIHQPLVFS